MPYEKRLKLFIALQIVKYHSFYLQIWGFQKRIPSKIINYNFSNQTILQLFSIVTLFLLVLFRGKKF